MAIVKKEKKRIVMVVGPKREPVEKGLVAVVKIAGQEFKIKANTAATRMVPEAGTLAARLGPVKFGEITRVTAQMMTKGGPVTVGMIEGVAGEISLKTGASMYLGKKTFPLNPL